MKKALQTSVLMSLVIIPMFFAFTANAAGRTVAQAKQPAKKNDMAATTPAADSAAAPTTPTAPANPFSFAAPTFESKAIEACEKAGVNVVSLTSGGSLSTAQKGCVVMLAEAGAPPCGKDYSEAKTAAKDLKKICGQLGTSNIKMCLENAFTCANEDPDASAAEAAADQEQARAMGLDIETDKSVVKSKCVKYSRKDYDAQKKEISEKLRETKKDLEAAQKERAKSAEEYAGNKRKSVEKQSRIQEQLSKLADSNQKDAQDRAQEMGKAAIEMEKEQAQVRVQNIQAQGQIAKIQGERAGALARLTDAMISTNCMNQMDLLLRKWALEGPKTVNGSAALFMSNAEKKRRIQDEHRACIETATATRRQLRKEYGAQVTAVREQIKGNDKQSAALEEQKGRQAADYQAFMARQQASQTEAFTRAQQELGAVAQENQEIELARQSRNNEAAKSIKENEDRIASLSAAMDNLGAEPKPRAEKSSGDAVDAAKSFLDTIEIFKTNACAALVPSMEKMISNEVKDVIKKNTQDTSTSTTSSTSKSGTK